MTTDISSLYKRFTAIEQEVAYIDRKRREEAEKAVAALALITDEDVERVSEYVPDLVSLKKCTVEDLIENRNGELLKLQLVYGQLTDLLDSWLKTYEDNLC